MGFREQFENAKARLLADPLVCDPNRALFAEFFAFEEYKLKRQNGLMALDDGCYKTLYGYIQRLQNVNRWFENKPWRDLTKDEIKRVYDALEDGTIRTRKGTQFQHRASYYNKIFKSKPFKLAGKAEMAREVIEYSIEAAKPVRYVTEEMFRLIVSVVANPTHLFLLWLAWDIGENVNSLLQLTKRDFIPQSNRYTGEREYLVNLPAAKLKRSRQARSEVTLYPETVKYADVVLRDLGPNDRPFPFGHRQAAMMFTGAVERVGATSMPQNDPVRLKDLRSGMACHLLKSGLTRDEVNARLGHTPHSAALDAYINFLALDRDKPKQRLAESTAAGLRFELDEARRTAHLVGERLRTKEVEEQSWKQELVRTRNDLDALRKMVERLMPVSATSIGTLRVSGEN